MSFNGIYSHYSDNLAWGASISASVAPMSSYSLSTLVSPYPGDRLRFSTGTVTIHLHGFGGSSPGNVISPNLLAIPVSNLQGSVLTLTNSAGLSRSVSLPTMPANGIPLTAVLDFSSSSNRSADTYHLVISGNASNVILGGGLWLGTKRTLSRNYRYSFQEQEDGYGPELTNEYGTTHLVDLRTRTRTFHCDFMTTAASVSELKAWHQDGRKRPTLFWPNPLVNDAYLGRWSGPFSVQRIHPNAALVQMDFAELSKGKPVA